MRDVYIVSAVRTAIGKARRTLAQMDPVEMGVVVVKEAVARAGVPGDKIEDVVIGCAFPEAEQGMNMARCISIGAGLPDTVPAMTINRFCSSGMESLALTAAKIQAGFLDVAITGGVETMSRIPMSGVKFAPSPMMTKEYCEVYTAMGTCGDNVARDFNITREECDEWGLRSVENAVAAIDAGKFKEQIVPLEVPTASGTITFDTDEGPRRDTTLEGLKALRLAFAGPGRKGVCTAGNSSQMSDGASAVCLMTEEAAKEYGATPMAKFLGYAAGAGSPSYLGPGQLMAIPKALKIAGLKVEDLGLIENNEAFATQCLYVNREMKFTNTDIINVNGGAIALGHPLGCTGSKLTTQIIHEMRARGVKHGLVTMCIGGGMGAAGVFELCE